MNIYVYRMIVITVRTVAWNYYNESLILLRLLYNNKKGGEKYE